MSKRVSRSREPNRNSASALAVSVLPTPVGPMNSSDAIGLRGRFSPALTAAITSTTSSTASSWSEDALAEPAADAAEVQRLLRVEQEARQPRLARERGQHVGGRDALGLGPVAQQVVQETQGAAGVGGVGGVTAVQPVEHVQRVRRQRFAARLRGRSPRRGPGSPGLAPSSGSETVSR